jgi:hypothetical protein
VAPAEVEDVGGHPRARFPLKVWAQGGFSRDTTGQTLRRVVEDWNALARDVLGVSVFDPVEAREPADIRISVGSRPAESKPLGWAGSRPGPDGVIPVPLMIQVYASVPALDRWNIDRETALYGVAVHELGHALGLNHVRDPRSIMCCVDMRGDLGDGIKWSLHQRALRAPDLASVREQLAEHYARVWSAAR